ncbi:hypothetical protein AB205_0128820, partial [Aquarana catesbeiana]
MVIANDATVKGGTAYPISVKKQLRMQEIALQNRLPTVYLVDSGGAFLPLQAQLFPDKEHGGRTFYNEAIMSALKIPQVAVVCGSCTAGGAYIPTMAEETIMVDRIGTIFLAGPPLVKAATGEDVSAEELGGAKLHSRLKEESSAFYSSARLWDDGVILPEDTRQGCSHCICWLMAALRLYRHLQPPQCCRLSSRAAQAFPVLRGDILPIHRHVYEANSRNSERCRERYLELTEKVKLGGGENAILRHTQRNKKLLVRERLKLLLDNENFLELSPLVGLGLPYGDVPSAGCLAGIGKVCGIWCMVIANDATVKGGTAYPISVKKQLRMQEIALQNRLPTVYLVDSGGAFLPLQAQLFPDKEHGGRTFYNEAIMSALKIPQVAVVCGSCTAGGAYIPTMAEETIMVDRIGTIFLAGPPLVKAATGEDVSAEELGGAKLHSRVSGCVDHFAATEQEAYSCTRLIISTLNFDPPPDGCADFEDPLYDTRELAGLAPRDYSCTLDIKLVLSKCLQIINQRKYERAAFHSSPVLRIFKKDLCSEQNFHVIAGHSQPVVCLRPELSSLTIPDVPLL